MTHGAGPESVHVSLPGDRPPWTPTGLRVRAGDRVTLLGSGFVRWSPRHDVGAGTKYHLWGRVPGGEIFGCTADTTTAVVDTDGELELCVYLGAWADRSGTLATGDAPYARVSGGLEVTVLRWPDGVDPADGLAGLGPDDAAPALVAAERERLAHPIRRPEGWEYLLDFGPGDIYRATELDGAPAIEVVCDDDAGILRTPVDVALGPDTVLEWTWRVDALPSAVAEDTTFTHDYLSIAVEFDSGRDLTWFWSAGCEPVTGTFACPIRGWRDRETHMPLRSGTDGLGVVHRERRHVHADHERFMGPAPERIVRVWLIAVSHFGRGTGRAVFSDIVLTDGDTRVRVL
ncbi:DUF3047 family protein [Pseudonocardia sediminis]|uniref:DUF3047 family protein n=1 Tax=Pseudonocardia sediminis TaxID=1397368 RepID=A0A4Q7UQS7_PSEST|nr:DUF3047 domain-containing protein [Pseudonocardia sediminis]RZT83926.1 DUF3047 family protein [Pseudonocardia sediminis]